MSKHFPLIFLFICLSSLSLSAEIPTELAELRKGWEDQRSEAQAKIDFNKKGMSSEQATGTASSYSRKYALNGLFLIDDTQDVDSMDNSVRQSNAAPKNTSAKPNTKIRLPNKGVEFDKVKQYLKGGGDIKAVKLKYVVSKEVEQLLNQ